MTVLACDKQSGGPLLALGDVHIRITLQEQAHHLHMTVPACEMKSCAPRSPGEVHIRVALQEQAHHLHVTVLACAK